MYRNLPFARQRPISAFSSFVREHTLSGYLRSLGVWAVPGAMLGIGLAATLIWWTTQESDVRDGEARRFAEIAGRIAAQVDEGILMREQIVVGIAAMAGMDAKRSQSIDWGEYITRLNRDSERDLAPTAGFMPRVAAADLPKHESQQRRAGHTGGADLMVLLPREHAGQDWSQGLSQQAEKAA